MWYEFVDVFVLIDEWKHEVGSKAWNTCTLCINCGMHTKCLMKCLGEINRWNGMQVMDEIV